MATSWEAGCGPEAEIKIKIIHLAWVHPACISQSETEACACGFAQANYRSAAINL